MTRRTFLRNAATLGTAATLACAIRAQPASPQTSGRRYRLALNPGSIGVRGTQQQIIDLAIRHGFEAVEPFPAELATLGIDALAALRNQMRDRGLSWGSAGLPVDFRGTDERFTADLQALGPLAKALQSAGATRVGTWLSPSHRSLTYTRNFQQHTQRLRKVAERLRDHGLRLGLEYVGTHTLLIGGRYPFIHTLAETRDLIDAIGTGNVGVVLDSWHWWQAGDTEADLLALRNEEIVAADLNDAPRGVEPRKQRDGERELPAATGVIDTPVFLGALRRIGYDGPIRAEPFNRALNELDDEAACAAVISAMRKAVEQAEQRL